MKGIGGLHCKSNQEVLMDSITKLENIIKRTVDRLELLENELNKPTDDIPFDVKFRSAVAVIKDDSRIVYMDSREYYPTFKEGEK